MPESIATLYHLQKTANFYIPPQCGIQLVNSQLIIKKLQSAIYVIDPVRTPGIVHAENLGAESAKTTEEYLKTSMRTCDFTIECHMGVRLPANHSYRY